MAYNKNRQSDKRPFKPRPEPITIDTTLVASELRSRFSDVTRSIRDNRKGSKLYKWQVEFTYYIDQIVRGPVYIAPKFVSITHHLINSIDADVKKSSANNRVARR